MSLKRLSEAFDCHTRLPIEIGDMCDAIKDLGIQDDILLVPEDMDPATLRGVYYQYKIPNGVYTAPSLCSLIVYSSRLSTGWQRIVCAKELVHILDSQAERTQTERDLHGLLDKLLGPLSTEDYGLADLMAAKDKLAFYQAIVVLFPDGPRQEARNALASGAATLDVISSWAVLPIPLVELVMSDDWPGVKAGLLNL